MNVQRNVSESQVRAELTSVHVLLLGIFQRLSDGKRQCHRVQGYSGSWPVACLFSSPWGWLMSRSKARDLSLQDKASGAFIQLQHWPPVSSFNSLHVGFNLDRRARSQLTAPPPPPGVSLKQVGFC